MNQSELRDLLHEKAKEFWPHPRIPSQIKRQAKRRMLRSTVGAGLAITLLLSGTGLLVTQLPQDPRTPAHLTMVPLEIDLVDYYDNGRDEPDESRRELDRRVDCMRAEGFDVPEPTRTDHGWAVMVEDPEALGFESREWREAAFVDCRPDPPPGPGHLIMPGTLSPDDIEVFRSCMEAEGFALPIPEPGDGNVWRFDGRNLDFVGDAFHRALFVTCWTGEGS